MEGGQPYPGRSVSDQPLDALTHLARRLVGEGDGQNLIRLGVAVADEVRDAVGNDARLARTRAGEDQQRSRIVQHRLTLLRVQFVEELHGGTVGELYRDAECGMRDAMRI